MFSIFSPITSISKAGVAIIRISGNECQNCLRALGYNKNLSSHKIFFHKIIDPKNNQLIDETLISFFKSPHSFTGEDVVEINIHGSPYILKKITEILLTQPNLRFAQPGEFSKRAFLNGKIDLVQAEAIPDLIASETEMQHRQAIEQLSGKLGKIYEKWRLDLLEIIALIEANIDFPEDDIEPSTIQKIEFELNKIRNEISNHLNDNKIGQKIKDGLNLVILGSPNVGKSSLINFLAQSDIAIVSDIAGTTRDIIQIHLEIKGIAVKIADTAGLRITNDLIEQEGIKRAMQKANFADIKILVIDAINPIFNEDLIDENTIIVINKIDQINNFNLNNFIQNNNFPQLLNNQLKLQDIATISLTNNINTSILIEILERKIMEILPINNSPLITQERYRKILQDCLVNLENFSLKKNIELSAHDLWMASQELGKITGKIDIENVLDIIFSRFCIGK